MNLKKIILCVVSIIAIVIIFNTCLGATPEEKEEQQQIGNVEFMKNFPTYYVEKLESQDGITVVNLYRKNRADGTIPDSVTVNFYEDVTPSVQYLHKGDSIKVSISVLEEETRIEGRYLEYTTYTADLFIFVDQISNLTQKFKK